MTPYILFFNAANQWNVGKPDGHAVATDPFVDEWIVGVLDGGYITEDMIDDGLRIVSHHKGLSDALDALRHLVDAGVPA